MKKRKIINTPMWMIIIGNLILGGLLLYAILFVSTSIGYSKLNPSNDYKVYVGSNVINILNSEYNPDLEQAYCIVGTVDDTNKKVTITNITSLNLKSQASDIATTSERFACSDKLGILHTHPKYLGIFPQCQFSESDIYTLGENFANKRISRVGGVYCDKNKIAFYLSNTETNEEIFVNNRKIGYELI